MLKNIKTIIIFKVLLLSFCIFFTNKINLLNTLSLNAYQEIGSFIIITLTLIYAFESKTSNKLQKFLAKHQKLQVPVSALLGVIPGCGGAIIVVTQYSRGLVSFGSLLSTLIATMGDASIILIQQKPQATFILFSIVIITAIIFGYLTDLLSKEKFLPLTNQTPQNHSHTHQNSKAITTTWLAIAIINILIYFLPSFLSKNINQTLCFIGISTCFLIWILQNSKIACNLQCNTLTNRIIKESSFIISWAFISICLFEIIIHLTQFNIAQFIKGNIYYIPLAAAIIGLIPGCGPQIIITTLYIKGMIPLSALVANAISNDGDAIIPAIILQPKKALTATFYTFFIGIIIGYIVLFFGF